MNMQAVQGTPSEANVFSLNEFNTPKKSNSFEMVMSQINIPDPAMFKAEYIKRWQEASVKQELLTVLLCEIDCLDEYIAFYGEQGASFMLVTMALLLKNSCDQHNCFIARNEQQGFSILIQSGTAQEAQAIADNLCALVKGSNTEHKSSHIASTVTLSIGATSFNPVTPAIMREQATSALHFAQKNGGNKSQAAQALPAQEIINYSNSERETAATATEQVDTEVQTAPSSELSNEPMAPSATQTYRGQVINNPTKNSDTSALKANSDALQESEKAPVKKKVRMYRGQIVKD